MKELTVVLPAVYVFGFIYASIIWAHNESRLPAAVCLLWPLWLLRELGRALRGLFLPESEKPKDLLREFSCRVKIIGPAHGAVRVTISTSPEKGYLLEIKPVYRNSRELSHRKRSTSRRPTGLHTSP